MDWVDQARRQREIEFEPKYGPIKPKSDPRCFRRERLEELLDALNYAQWAFQKGELNRKQYKEIDRTTRSVIRTIEAACSDKFEWEARWL